MAEKNKIIVYIEAGEDNEILPVSLEAIQIGKQLSLKKQGELVAVIIGKGMEKATDALLHYGIDKIYCADHPDLEVYQSVYYLPVLLDLCEKENPFAILFANTLHAIDLAPRIAQKLDAGLITDCVNITTEEGEMLCTKAVYSSNVMAEYGFDSPVCIATIRARSFEPCEENDAASGEVIPLSLNIDTTANEIELVERTIREEEGINLSSADIVVSGGRGMGGEEGFEHLKDLCDTMGAALGSSRPPCDLEWVPARTQVGLTGEIIAPSLYIAVGISGSFQHISGMNDSKVIVAINRDERSNIFNIANYGIVGEFEDIIPEFNKTLKEIL